METEKFWKIKKIVAMLLAVLLIAAVTVTAVSAEDASFKESGILAISYSNPTVTPVNDDISCGLKDNGIPPD